MTAAATETTGEIKVFRQTGILRRIAGKEAALR